MNLFANVCQILYVVCQRKVLLDVFLNQRIRNARFYETMHWEHGYCERNNGNRVKEEMTSSSLIKKIKNPHNPHTSDTEVWFCKEIVLPLSQSSIRYVLHFSDMSSSVVVIIKTSVIAFHAMLTD